MTEILNAKIVKTSVGFEDHGSYQILLELDCGEENPTLAFAPCYNPYTGEGSAFLFAFGRTLEVAGVQFWQQLVGKYIRVKRDGPDVVAIGHILNDDWFNRLTDFE